MIADPVYAAVAERYREAGWLGVIPLPPGKKKDPPSGFTGRRGQYPKDDHVRAWARGRPGDNVGLRMPPDVIGIDVDAYGSKRGGATLKLAEQKWGPLPATWRSTSRPDDPRSGIRFFRVPQGLELAEDVRITSAEGELLSDIEVVQRHHRYAVVWPSIHPERRRYVWFNPDGELVGDGAVPQADDLPELPRGWLEGLRQQPSHNGNADLKTVLDALPDGESCRRMAEERVLALEACTEGSRHDGVMRRVMAIVRLGERGHPGAPTVLKELRQHFVDAVSPDREQGVDEAEHEFTRMLQGATAAIAASPTRESKRGCHCDGVDDQGMADAHLAEMVATDRLGVAYRWGRGLGWMHWDGRHWADCADEVVIEEVRTYLLERYREALGELERLKAQVKELERDAANGIAPDAEQLEKLKKSRDKAEELKDAWYSKLSGGRIFTLSRLTRGILLCEATRFDAHPDLLNVANGVVDLRSGELRPHDPDLLLTKLVKVGYVPGARHPDWAKALEALPQDEHAWYQQRLGQAITGYPPPDDRVLIQQGSGENGKTTIMAGIKALLGDYAVLVSERVLLSNPDNHPTELMDLRGARLALIEETPEARRLSVQRLKQIVGQPWITARRIRQDPVTFPTTHAQIVSTNYLPVVEETDHGTWRRLICLRFQRTFRKPGEALKGPNDRIGDPGLRDRIKDSPGGQHEAIMAWLVEGAVGWYRNARVMSPLPPRTEHDTRDWRCQSDLILGYLNERLIFDLGRHVISTELVADFNDWLQANGNQPWSDRTFCARFGGHEEVQSHAAQKKIVWYDADRLSRRPEAETAVVPKQYTAWLGIRFRTAGDPSTMPTRRRRAAGAHSMSQRTALSGTPPIGSGRVARLDTGPRTRHGARTPSMAPPVPGNQGARTSRHSRQRRQPPAKADNPGTRKCLHRLHKAPPSPM